MHQTLILGDGPMGWAIAAATAARGERSPVAGRPPGSRHDAVAFAGIDLLVDATRGDAVAANVAAGLDGGVRRFVIATTGWTDDRGAVEDALRSCGASAVVSANFSLGVALFTRLVETATELFRGVADADPYLVEWHRRGKRDRPSGTALDLARRMADRDPRLSGPDGLELVAIRAGSSPGMHLVGFDAPGETVELRITARDRSAYAAGILAAADWLRAAPRRPGIHPFDPVVDDLLAARRATAA